MQIVQSFNEAEGHTTLVLDLAADLEEARRKIIEVLQQVWVGDILYDDDIDEYANALREFGVDLETELRSRGLSEPLSDKKDRLIKDRGDIGEVLGYLREISVRGVAPSEMFMPLLWAKLKGGVTTHGLDGIGFLWGSEGEPDKMILSEWKHTTDNDSIHAPCSRASSEWSDLTFRKLMQELRRVRRVYQDRGLPDRAQRLKWFAFLWQQRDANVSCATLVAHPDSVTIDKARREVSTHLVAKCADHPSNPLEPRMHEANLLPLSDLPGFLDSCYQEFTYGGGS